MNLDQLIRESDPARGLDIHAPDPRRITSRRRSGHLGGTVGLGLAVAVALAVALGALVLHRGSPQTQSQSQASRAQPLLRILGALRQPQEHRRASDQLARDLFRGGTTWPPFGAPDRALIRLARTHWGQKIFLVPFKPAANTTASLARLPPRSRRAIELRLKRRGHAYELGIFGGRGGPIGGSCCSTASAIASHGEAAIGIHGPNPCCTASDFTEGVLVVPDGVAKVTLLFRAGFTHPGPLETVTGIVKHNVFVISFAGATHNPTENMVWYGPGGNIVKRIGHTSGLGRARPAPRAPG